MFDKEGKVKENGRGTIRIEAEPLDKSQKRIQFVVKTSLTAKKTGKK